MAKQNFMGVEEARKAFPQLIDSARQGGTTIITRHGKACAAVVPVEAASRTQARASLGILSLRGSGRGLFGDAARAVDRMRRDWD